MRINTKDEPLRDILSSRKKYFVPKFQRDYSWESEQLEDLWHDIYIMKEDDYHYMGYLVIQEQDRNTFKIIDGQQRLTTFSLMILAAMKKLKKENEQERQKELYRDFIGTKNIETLEVENKLKLNKNNDYYYGEAAEGRDLPTRGQKRTVHLMEKSITYFYDQFQSMNAKEIAKLIEKISSNLLFTTIYISDEISAYKVFETLNSRGVQLSSGDLIKNYLFTIIDENNTAPGNVIDKIEERWAKIGDDIGDKSYTNYILDEWNSRNELIRKSALFREIRKKINTKQKADNYLIKLTEYSQLYNALNNNEDEFWKDHKDYLEIKKDLHFLKLFNIKQPTSLLLISYIKWREKFSQILKWIKVLSLRYNVICREHTGEQEILYNKICLMIYKDCNVQKIKEKMLSIYPKDEKFKLDFAEKTMPTKQSNKKARYLLARLEEEKIKGSIDETSQTIEHILPLNPKGNWADFKDLSLFNQRLGNMALVDEKTNKNLAQKTFEEKREILNKKDSINNISDYNEWNFKSIESRQKTMAKLASQLWRIDNQNH